MPGPEVDKALPWAELDARSSRTWTPCGDGQMLWRSWGQGDLPLVFFHGGAGSWLHWIRTVPAFAATHRVIAPDLPGLGGSASPPNGAGGADIAAIVAAGLDAVIGKDASCDLIGFSFGGVMAGSGGFHPEAGSFAHAGRLRRVSASSGPGSRLCNAFATRRAPPATKRIAPISMRG